MKTIITVTPAGFPVRIAVAEPKAKVETISKEIKGTVKQGA
ncbi:hypothetical protein [Flammeovirga sp. SJP92]|nr:hypothetical protein [Flammeovirga sp. SJP92]